MIDIAPKYKCSECGAHFRFSPADKGVITAGDGRGGVFTVLDTSYLDSLCPACRSRKVIGINPNPASGGTQHLTT